MLKPLDIDVLEAKVYSLLEDVGIAVENEELSDMCLQGGCLAGTDHRIRIPRRIIREMTDFQKKTQAEYEELCRLVLTCGPDWAHHLLWTGQADAFHRRSRKGLFMQAFDCGPSAFFDHASGTRRPVDGKIFTTMMKLAHALPEIGYTSTWYRQDLPPQVERIESLVNGLKLTDKLDGIECIDPRAIRYLQEASEIVYGDAHACAFLAGSECMTMPLILEKRSAEDIRRRPPPCSARPSAFENYYGTSLRRRWDADAAIPYAGMGALGNGGTGSPEQLILDMEIRRAEWAYRDEIPVDDETMDWEEVLQVSRDRGTFLASDHTARHCRDLWASRLFLSDSPLAGAWDGSEKAILDTCAAMWHEAVAKWVPPSWPPDKEKALDDLLVRARAGLCT